MLSGILYVVLVFVHAIRIAPSGMSVFEQRRRAKSGDEALPRRDRLVPRLLTLRDVVRVVLVLALFGTLVAATGWLIGSIGILGMLLLLPLIARLTRRWCQTWYERGEVRLLTFAERPVVKMFCRWLALHTEQPPDNTPASYDEWRHMLTSSKVASAQERDFLVRALAFLPLTVSDVVQPMDEIITVAQDEILGPKRLDELHKTKQRFFPVMDVLQKKVVGIVAADDIMHTQRQGKTVVADVARDTVVQVTNEQSLVELVKMFLHQGQHLFIVVDKSKETIGVITIETIIAKLFPSAAK